MEWIAAIRYAAKTARSKDLIGDKPESHFSLNPRLLTTEDPDLVTLQRKRYACREHPTATLREEA